MNSGSGYWNYMDKFLSFGSQTVCLTLVLFNSVTVLLRCETWKALKPRFCERYIFIILIYVKYEYNMNNYMRMIRLQIQLSGRELTQKFQEPEFDSHTKINTFYYYIIFQIFCQNYRRFEVYLLTSQQISLLQLHGQWQKRFWSQKLQTSVLTATVAQIFNPVLLGHTDQWVMPTNVVGGLH